MAVSLDKTPAPQPGTTDYQLVTVEVVTRATLTLPVGAKLEGNVLVMPSGERFKFWVQAELQDDESGDCVNVNESHLALRDIHLEHDGAELVMGQPGVNFVDYTG